MRLHRHAFSVLAALILGVVLLPFVAVLAAALSGSFSAVSSLADTVLLGYAANTVGLVLLTGTMSLVIGVSTAWLVTMTEFPGRRLLEVALVLPFAFPATNR